MALSDRKILITGVSGLLGNNLAYYFKNKDNILGLFYSHPVIIPGIKTARANLLEINTMRKIIEEFQPSVIIHCASLANVDLCECSPETAIQINVAGTKNVVDIIRNKNTFLIYLSSDSVYNGFRGNFSETDEIDPLNIYGRSKFLGEQEAQKTSSLILRTNFFGWNIIEKKSLAEWILGELETSKNIPGFRDAIFSSIYTFELARIMDIAIQNRLTGIFNCGSSDSCSKYDFALRIAKRFGFEGDHITPISIETFPFKAKRGNNLSLNVKKIQEVTGYRLPTIDQSIEEYYKDYRCGLPREIKRNLWESQKASLFIPYGKQNIDENDIQEVADVLHAERITQGPKIEEFENKLAEYCGANYAVTTNSGTSALHIACLAASIESGDEAITSPITFVASANCIAYCKARPIFADIDAKTYNIHPDEIRKKFTKNTKAVIPVHLAGQSCDVDSIRTLVKEKEEEFHSKIFIIEDATHALGSDYKKTKVGSCAFSHMAVLSFHPLKHITTGEGGAVLTNDKNLYYRLKLFRSHGIIHNPEDFHYHDQAFQPNVSSLSTKANPWYYEQVALGYNYRLTDIQSSLGISQLKRLAEVKKRRREIVNVYNQALGKIEGIQTPFESETCNSNFHLYILLIDFDLLGLTRTQLMYDLKRQGIQTQVHYIPVHTQPFYQKNYGTAWGDCPVAEAYYKKCLSIPLFPIMTDNDVNKVINAIKNACESRRLKSGDL